MNVINTFGWNKDTIDERELHKIDLSMQSGDFYVVGIGASAGGLEALEQFFANMSAIWPL